MITHVDQLVQVKSLRGKAFATVDMIDTSGSIRRRDKTLVVQFPLDKIEVVKIGSIWRISGQELTRDYVVNGYGVSEYTVPKAKASYVRPSNRMMSRWISANVDGIGQVIASRLSRLANLNQLVINSDKESLMNVRGMNKTRVDRLIEQWPAESIHETIEWLESYDLPLGPAEILVQSFEGEAIEKVKADPFILMSLGMGFAKTFEFAERLGFSRTGPQIVSGVILHVAIQFTEKTGSTVFKFDNLLGSFSRFLPNFSIQEAVQIALDKGQIVEVVDGYSVYGTALMELSVAQFIALLDTRKGGEGDILASWELQLEEKSVQSALVSFESTLDFSLTDEQRSAVVCSIISPVCGISGGAGTGKTTILKAVLDVYEDIAGTHLPLYQVALSGRAAQRMAESTGRPASTIAKFIADHFGDNKPDLPTHLLLVIDESSMVDLLSMYRLVGILPPATRLIFLGDTAQLPPVGCGLVFHALIDSHVPFSNLSQVKRQSLGSGIHRFANGIRSSKVQSPDQIGTSLSVSADCVIETSLELSRLVELWEESGGIESSIILSPIRSGDHGVVNVNRVLQEHIGTDRAAIHYEDSQGWLPWITSSGTKLYVGDPILVTRNHYDDDADLRNGDLGLISKVFSETQSDGSVAILELNKQKVPITYDILEKLDLGYAVTIHKSQGSQWKSVFVLLPHSASQMIDQSLIYTAATRPTDRLVLVGDESLINQSVTRGFVADHRQVSLRGRLEVLAM